MRDEKEERKKQARSNKQTRQSNTAHPRQSLFLEKMSCLGGTCILCIHSCTMHVLFQHFSSNHRIVGNPRPACVVCDGLFMYCYMWFERRLLWFSDYKYNIHTCILSYKLYHMYVH